MGVAVICAVSLPLLRKEKALPNGQDFFLQEGQVVLCSECAAKLHAKLRLVVMM
jgi:hypothetical protein